MSVCVCDSLCRALDDKVKLLLNDADHYIQPTPASVPDSNDGPFDRFADKKQVTDYLQKACENYITKWVYGLLIVHACLVILTVLIEGLRERAE